MNAITNHSKPARTPRDYSSHGSGYGWTQTDENNRREVARWLAELDAHNAAAGPPLAPKPEDADDEPPDKDATPMLPELPDDDIPAEPDDYVPPPSHGQHERQQQRAREATQQAVGVPVVSESEGVILP